MAPKGGYKSLGFSGNVFTNIWNYGLSPVGPMRVIATTVAAGGELTGDTSVKKQAQNEIHKGAGYDEDMAPVGLGVLSYAVPIAGTAASLVYKLGPAAEAQRLAANEAETARNAMYRKIFGMGQQQGQTSTINYLYDFISSTDTSGSITGQQVSTRGEGYIDDTEEEDILKKLERELIALLNKIFGEPIPMGKGVL